ncbi:MAG: TatD family hydrolase [Deltaproteobacteria bacterium]|nr:TatD family hydrolase [Deltaproteobacteria bacterium]
MKEDQLPGLSLIDAHVHLNAIEPIQSAISNARSAGVKRIVAVGMDLPSNIKTLELAKQFPDIVCPAVGYHPWSIIEDEIEATLLFIDQHLGDCVALGEVGLDYKVKIKKPIQYKVFSKVLELAQQHQKPVIVHSRYSYERTHAMVSAAGIPNAVFHWYSGPPDVLDKIIADGYFISATPALAYSKQHQAAIKKTPLSQILIETDAPVEYQGKVSEPASLVDTLKALGSLKNRSVAEIALITTENSEKFYKI